MGDSKVFDRDQAEVERSAEEARNTVLKDADRTQIDRYLSPRSDTVYSLEYAFYLLGDVRGKTVLDLGCGTGENIIPLLERGARVTGIDISPDLIALAEQRLRKARKEATVRTGSAYDTGMKTGSVDIVFCMSLVHHLDVERVRDEMLRILATGGVVILKEPIRFSKAYAFLRGLLPARGNISEFEHPLTREELATMTEHFEVQGTRYFRLPSLPLIVGILPSLSSAVWKADGWVLRHCPPMRRYATVAAMRLVKTAS
ncbi:MAG: methyltransferase domain-containing protein [Candidatus Sulfotelmatobacter sp.]